MTHDFDAAIEYVASACPSFSPSISDEDLNAILFALRFTKAALSGEVSGAVLDAAYHSAHETYPGVFQTMLLPPDEIFPAMCQQLAKEIGE